MILIHNTTYSNADDLMGRTTKETAVHYSTTANQLTGNGDRLLTTDDDDEDDDDDISVLQAAARVAVLLPVWKQPRCTLECVL